jgi:nucleolar protein 9
MRKPAQRKRDAQWSAPTGPTTQGSLLLQALAQLSAPHHSCVISRHAIPCPAASGTSSPVSHSLLALDPPALLALAHDNTASRVLDALLAAPAVPARTTRRVILAFVPVFAELVDDRVGARVGERLWAAADPYLQVSSSPLPLRRARGADAAQEKIGRALLAHEHALRASPCARPFARGLQLHVLRRNADEWRELHAASAAAAAAASAPEKRPPPAEPEGAEPTTDGKRRKRKRRAPDGDADGDGDNDLPGGADASADADGADGGDAIDALFAGAGLGGKTHKRGALAAAASATLDAAPPVRDSKPKKAKKEKKGDGAELGDVLGAIRDAPKGEARKRRKAG